MSAEDSQLLILIRARAQLEELVGAQNAMRLLGEEVKTTGFALKAGFGIDLARRGLDILTGTVRQFALEAVRMAGVIKDSAQNLGVSNQAYQVLGNTLHDAGGDASLLTQAISNNNRSLLEARTIGSAAAGAYRTLGLDIAKLEQLPVERRFELIGRAVLQSTDKTQAYSAASQLLGARNLPTLLGALKDLAENGWDKVTEAQLRAGRVMTDDTIARLDAAQKQIEKLKQSATIGVGEWLGDAFSLGAAIKRVFDDLPFAVLGSVAAPGKTGALFGQVWHDFIKEPGVGGPKPSADGANAANEIALKNALASAEFNLASAQLHRQSIEANPNVTDFGKKRLEIQLLGDELDLREKLISAVKATPLDATEMQQSRDLRVQKLEEQNRQLHDQLNRLKYGTEGSDKDQGSRDNFAKFQEDGGVFGGTNVGGSARLGAMDWVTGVGHAGEQVSGVNWCEQHPGQAVYVRLESGTDETSFLRSIARAIGTACSYGYKTSEMRVRIQDALQAGHLILVIDEAHFAFPQSDRSHRSAPMRIEWIRTALVDFNVPVALISTPQFFSRACAKFRKGGWNSLQVQRRLTRKTVLPAPEEVPLADVLKVVQRHFPKTKLTTRKQIAALAIATVGFFTTIVHLRKRLDFLLPRRPGVPESAVLTEAMHDMGLPKAADMAPASMPDRSVKPPLSLPQGRVTSPADTRSLANERLTLQPEHSTA